MTYESKLEMLKAHGIGLWDAYHNCIRPGRMDEDIGERELNDFSALKNIAPAMRLVCFNGKEAAKSEELLLGLGYVTRVLPSSSSANRRNAGERLSNSSIAGSCRSYGSYPSHDGFEGESKP
ncbi:MAG: hypothetical protein WAU92_07965 [Candidatus Sulfotelmatobacter sp.]